MKLIQIWPNSKPDGALVYMSKVAEITRELGLSVENYVTTGYLDFFKELSPSSHIATLNLTTQIKQFSNALVFLHGSIQPELLSQLKTSSNIIVVLAHNSCKFSMPQYYKYADYVVPVSQYVYTNLTRSCIDNIYANPIYPYVENQTLTSTTTIQANLLSVINWNHKKIRDAFLQLLQKTNLYKPISNDGASINERAFRLGVVSRLSRAKRFPNYLMLYAQYLRILKYHFIFMAPALIVK